MAEEKEQINCIKVVLSGGKEVLLREMKMKYQNLALQAIGNKAKDNQMLAGSLLVQELIKILIIKVDGQDVPKAKLEALDELFTYKQLTQLFSVVGKMTGGDDAEGEVLT